MTIWVVSAIGAAVGVTSLVVSTVQYNKNVDRMNAQEKKANQRAEGSKIREQEMAKRQLRLAAIEVGRRHLELSAAKQKKVSAMHEAIDSKANYAEVSVKPGARPMGRPVVG